MEFEQSKLAPRVLRPDGGRRPRTRLGLVAAAAIAAAMLPSADAVAAEPTVVTTTGTFTAVPSPSEAGVDVFFGIRYAAAPEGALRWTPPQAPVPPPGVVVASTPGAACPQGAIGGFPLAEDCLFLNVYIPASARPNSRLPVFYWIHGGSLTSGTGVEYDPSVMVANSDIIVVTINYRLGALGWLAEPGLVATAADTYENVGDAGNYGLMDQQFGLSWVQANIAAFGGDPGKVTIGGESAGGLSVSSNLASTNTAPGLFRAAIIESGGYMLHSVPSQATYQASFGPAFDAALGCSAPADAACLRSQSVANILNAQSAAFGGAGISPDFGTKILPLGLHTAFSTGAFNQVPVLQGSNANEGRLFEPDEIPAAGSAADVAAAGGPANYDIANPNAFCATPQGTGTPAACSYVQEINLYLGGLGLPAILNNPGFDGQLAGQYPLANFPDPYLANNAPSADEALAQIFTDLVFACNVLDSNTDLARWVPVYAYEFNDPLAPPLGSVIEPPNDAFGFPTASEHAAELSYLFNFGAPFNIGEQRLAAEMKSYWANFVISSNPNVGGNRFFYAPWSPFNFNHAIQDLVPGPAAPGPFFTFPTEHFCSTWQPIVAAE
jgi:para-nitrobenzyl esterase